MRSLTRVALCALLVFGMAAAAWAVDGPDEPLQKDELFIGTDRFAEGAKNVTEVNLDKKVLAMMERFARTDDEDKDQVNLAKKMDFVYVRSYEYAKSGQYRTGDLDAFRSRLEHAEWSHIVKDRSEGEQTDVWIQTDKEGKFSELVVISAERTELTFVHLKGHLSMKELSEAGVKYGVPQIPESKLQRRSK